jgi:hypothetical protein
MTIDCRDEVLVEESEVLLEILEVVPIAGGDDRLCGEPSRRDVAAAGGAQDASASTRG